MNCARESKCLKHSQFILVQENSKTKIKQDSCKDCILDMFKKINCEQQHQTIRSLIENQIENLQLNISYLNCSKKSHQRQTDFIPQIIEQELIRPCTEMKEIQKQQEKKQLHTKQIDAIDIILILDCTNYYFDVKPQHILYHDFTTNVQLIQNFIEMNEAKGGEDIPDDLVGGLEVAYKLDISENKDSMLQLLIITDAPCHGKSYHNLMIDLHTTGQDGRLENILLYQFLIFFDFQFGEQKLIVSKNSSKVLLSQLNSNLIIFFPKIFNIIVNQNT